MAARRGPRIQPGDVFSIPIDDARQGFGQVLLKNTVGFNLYIAVFAPSWSQGDRPSAEEIAASPVAFVGGTMDALIHNGRWRVIGNVDPVLERLPWPLYKSGRLDGVVMESFDGTVLRRASQDDLAYYDLRWSRAPIAFQQALMALHGVAVPDSNREKLTIDHARRMAATTPRGSCDG